MARSNRYGRPGGYARIRRKSRRSDMASRASRFTLTAALFAVCGIVLVLGSAIGELGPAASQMTLPTAAGHPSELVLSLDIDIVPEMPGTEIVTSHRTSNVDGYIELHAKTEQGYKRLARADSGPVTRLEAVDLGAGGNPGSSLGTGSTADGTLVPGRLIVVYSDYDQSVGAMSKSSVATAFAWDGRQLVDVWSATVKSEAVWNLAWDQMGQAQTEGARLNSWTWGAERGRRLDQDVLPAIAAKSGQNLGPGNWVRLASEAQVQFQPGATPSVLVRSRQEYQAYSEKEDTFTTIDSREIVQTYTWSGQWSAFILSEGSVGRNGTRGMAYPGDGSDGTTIPAGTPVAVLEAERQCVEGMVFKPPYLLRVKLPDGRRCFVDEGSVLTSVVRSMV